jgi:predicted nucleic acid-binding protein
VPRAILDLVVDGAFELILTPAILNEYLRTYDRLATQHPELQTRQPFLGLLAYGTLLPDPERQSAITRDADDDKFLLCARDAGAVVVSGDRHLIDASGWEGVQVLIPREFLNLLSSMDT